MTKTFAVIFEKRSHAHGGRESPHRLRGAASAALLLLPRRDQQEDRRHRSLAPLVNLNEV
jgi:hypothetical protein